MTSYSGAGQWLIDDVRWTSFEIARDVGSVVVENNLSGDALEPGDPVDIILDIATYPGYFFGTAGNGFIVQATEPWLMYFYVGPEALAQHEIITVDRTESFTVCFAAGTLIATPEGQRIVEELGIGDLVMTASGETRSIRWIGRQTVVAMFASPLKNYPIRIAAGALHDNIPLRDLYLSPEHALFMDGLLVQANALVNDTTVTRVAEPDQSFTYFHIELEDHSLILAEGTPAETFVDNVTRRRFDNFAEFETLYGRETGHIPEIALPRVKSARQLPERVRHRLAARASALGFTTAA